MRRSSGFSLMEMLIVLLIVAIVAAASAPMVSRKLASESGLATTAHCLWQENGKGSITFNADMKGVPQSEQGRKSVIIGTSFVTDENGNKIDANSKEKPRLFIKSNSIKNSHIELEGEDSKNIVKTLKVLFFNGNTWLSTKQIDKGAKDSVAIGNEADANKEGSVAIGSNAGANAYAVAIGSHVSNPTLAGQNSVAIGAGANSSSSNSIAIGTGTIINGRSAIAIGAGIQLEEKATAQDSIIIGKPTKFGNSMNSIAIGKSTDVTGNHAIAIGDGAKTGNAYSMAVGCNATALGYGSMTIGEGAIAKASANNSVAIGPSATVDHENSVVISNTHNGAVSTASNQIVLGNAGTTVYIPGNLVVGGNLATYNAFVNDTIITWRSNGLVGSAAADGYDKGLNWGMFHENNRYKRDDVKTWAPAKLWGEYYKFHTNSDRRLKNVGEVFKGGLDEIKKLEVFNYTYKKDKDKLPHVGVMAQDLQKIFPNAVFKGDDGFLRIRMEDMFYALVNAVKELDKRIDLLVEKQKEIDALRIELKSLKKDYTDLEKRLAKLEKQIKEK